MIEHILSLPLLVCIRLDISETFLVRFALAASYRGRHVAAEFTRHLRGLLDTRVEILGEIAHRVDSSLHDNCNLLVSYC